MHRKEGHGFSKNYPELRTRMDEVLRMMKDEVVFKLAQ